ncbi:small subunit ribosomal protein S24e [Thecamonas trahens ATCC 50062]|uniref:40S ribosomal protein S24 n=1 Tax=Thecamonas trahens ATCC 50062 TaxID=461836 RepID=A0A0L0DCV8_THETB|nr:small subunit ribosomal protein S24e [Thecamonas trahens ATCC 50062]KNC49153.1 small subunit ribosomal protein S24e [Thecamonas trahens ATCC 50062]|eukprot:XP_013758175.1 small subunit ribosomal protein S24e [Thecamonas trahens ATCC 50062]
MSTACTVRTSKFLTNALLGRRQMVVDVIHPSRASVPKTELREELAKKYNVADPSTIILFGFKIAFGGGRSKGFALIYDDAKARDAFEPKYRLIRAGLATATESSRRQRKELKNKLKKVRGTAKARK